MLLGAELPVNVNGVYMEAMLLVTEDLDMVVMGDAIGGFHPNEFYSFMQGAFDLVHGIESYSG